MPQFAEVKEYAKRDAFAIGWETTKAMHLSHATTIAFDLALKSNCFWKDNGCTLSTALSDWDRHRPGVGWSYYCTRFATYSRSYYDVSLQDGTARGE